MVELSLVITSVIILPALARPPLTVTVVGCPTVGVESETDEL
jgi:hypothetical protein